MKNPIYIIFSDLDGTLLDHNTYEYTDAQAALKFIIDKNIPLILTSSKTKVEMQGYQKKMGIEEFPFIVENGSAIYIKKNNLAINSDKETIGEYDCYCLGKTYSQIVEILNKISNDRNYNICGFHNTEKSEIIERTQLSSEAVTLAMNREYSVPLFYDDTAKEILMDEIEKYELQILYGGRFMHLLGKTDKGKAMNLVKSGYVNRFKSETIETIGIGDTLNDVAMLINADYKILVKRYDGKYDTRVQIDNLIYSPYIGPKGWNHSILKILRPEEEYE